MLDNRGSPCTTPASWLVTFGIDRSERSGVGFEPAKTGSGSDSPSPGSAGNRFAEATFRGWLFERDALRDGLGVPANEDLSDADLVLRAYRQWGTSAFARLRGSYTLWVWDERRRVLLCTRDLLGTFPCYYSRSGSAWLFSDSVDRLLGRLGDRPRLNREALAAYLAILGRDIEETFFEGVRRLPAGWLLRVDVDTGQASAERYWSPLADGEVGWLSDDEIRNFPALIEQAVKRYLQLGRPGVFLSGGLDSGTVAAVAATLRPRNGTALQAFSVVFEDPEANEESTQRALAAKLNLRQHLLRVDRTLAGKDLFSCALELNRDWPNPMVSSFLTVYLELGRLAHEKGADFVLTGDGGDEWLETHYSVSADHIRRLELAELLALFRHVRRSGASVLGAARLLLWESGLAPLLAGAAVSLLDQLAPDLLRSRRARLRGRLLPEWLIPDLELRTRLFEREEARSQRNGHRGNEREVLELLDHPLTGMYMDESYEIGRRCGLPLLKPFYDPDVISFLVRARPQQRNLGGRPKGLLREFLDGRFPELGYGSRPKPYGTNFFASRVFDGAKEARASLTGFPGLARLGLVDGAGADEFVSSVLQSRREEEAKSLWMLLSAEKWVGSRSVIA